MQRQLWLLSDQVLVDYRPHQIFAAVAFARNDACGVCGWAVDTSGTGADGHWKALDPAAPPLGGWDGGGDPAGAASTFPRLWWE